MTIEKLSHIHEASRNVIRKVYGTSKYFTYFNSLKGEGEVVRYIGDHYQTQEAYSWLFVNFEDFYIDRANETQIFLKRHSFGDYSRFGNKEYGIYVIEKKILSQPYTKYLHEVRKAAKLTKTRSDRVYVTMGGDELISTYEKRIKLIKKIQNDITNENWKI